MYNLINIEEPNLLFRFEQKMQDPRDGLTLFGPLENLKPYGIISGVIGTRGGIKKFKDFLKSIQSPVFNNDNYSRPFFPGFEAVFGIEWSPTKIHEIELDYEQIEKAIFHEEVFERTYNTVRLYTDKIIKAVKDDHVNVDTWFIVIPDIIYQYCRPMSTISAELVTTAKKVSKSQAKKYIDEPSFFKSINEEVKVFKYEANFHHQLKAVLLDKAIPTQIIRESTLCPHDFLNKFGVPKRDFSKIEGHRAWSISTAAFYKTGGRPWKLADIREGVCYIGLVYKIDEKNNPRNACCAAQMFLDSGDGIVFKGAVGPWYNSQKGEFHLKPKQAKELIALAVSTYKKIHNNKPPKELFIHAKTKFNNEEWDGFKDAIDKDTHLVGVTIKKDKGLKLYRDLSKYPILRGISYIQNERSGYLWTKGYVPRLESSIAFEVPNPLFIEISKGEANINTVMKDVLALTKLNYNACIYGDGEPVTLRFANKVGEILIAAPLEDTPPLSFKYYI